MIRAANVVNITQHPERDTGLRERAEDTGVALREPNCSWSDLEVVAKFLVLGKEDALGYDVFGENFELQCYQQRQLSELDGGRRRYVQPYWRAASRRTYIHPGREN